MSVFYCHNSPSITLVEFWWFLSWWIRYSTHDMATDLTKTIAFQENLILNWKYLELIQNCSTVESCGTTTKIKVHSNIVTLEVHILYELQILPLYLFNSRCSLWTFAVLLTRYYQNILSLLIFHEVIISLILSSFL